MPQKRESIKFMKSDTTSSLTESTQYTSEDASSTLSSKSNQIDEEEEDSYFSEGAWLLSKSEGQIVPLKQNGLFH
jgi:hypothetical protein